MKRKHIIFLVIIIVIVIVALFYGAMRHLDITMDNGRFSISMDSPKKATIHKNLEAFDSIDIKLNNADIELKSGNNYAMFYHGKKDECPTATIKDGLLTIKESHTHSLSNNSPELVITIPKNINTLENVSLVSSDGDITIEPINKLSIHALTMDSSNGDLDLEQSIVNNLIATSFNGDIDVEDSSLTTSSLKTSNGDISVSLADHLNNYFVSVKSDSGDISIGDNDYDSGSIQVGHGSQKITAQTDNGDIDIEND